MVLNVESLKKVPIFSSLEEESLRELTTIAREKRFRKHQIIFDEGDTGDSLFIIKSGMVKISLSNSKSHEFIIKTLSDGEHFGELSLLDEGHRSATTTAIEDTQTIVFHQKDLISLIQKNPMVALEVIKTLVKRLRVANEKITNLTFYDAYGKVAHCLLTLMEETGEREGNQMVLDIKLSRQELANMAGLSRETFSRILKDFQLRECIQVKGKKIIIANESILKKETAF